MTGGGSSSSSSSPKSVNNGLAAEQQQQQQQHQKQHQQQHPCWNFYYLSDEAAHNLPKFQYRGQDLSILYKYVLSPVANFCVEHLTPSWLAPNTITLIGLILMCTAYGAAWYFVPTLELSPPSSSSSSSTAGDDEPPRWIFLWNAVAMLIYQTLDNMDGKQARKTKSSSPLGLLFDHGIDAVNSVFGSANWMIAMMLHPRRDTLLCFTILFGPYGLFFISTWEEYFTGELIMPIFNGPSEGLMGGALMSLTSWWYGPAFWQQTTVWDHYIMPFLQCILPGFVTPSLRHCDLLVLGCGIGFIQEMVLKSIFVVRTFGAKSTIPKLLPFVTLVLCAVVVGMVDLDVWLSMPRTSLHLSSALFVDMTSSLMMAHITHQPYPLTERWLIVPLVLLTIGVCTGAMTRSATSDFLLIFTTFCVAHLLLRFAVIIHEICTVLNIWCFDITTPRTPPLQRIIAPATAISNGYHPPPHPKQS